MKIEYINGIIQFSLGEMKVQITNLSQVYAVSDLLKSCILDSKCQEIHDELMGIVDIFNMVKKDFIRNRELQCLENSLSIHEFESNM